MTVFMEQTKLIRFLERARDSSEADYPDLVENLCSIQYVFDPAADRDTAGGV